MPHRFSKVHIFYCSYYAPDELAFHRKFHHVDPAPYRVFVYHRGGAEKMRAPAIVDVAHQQPYRVFVYHRRGAEKMGAPAIVEVANQQPYRVFVYHRGGAEKMEPPVRHL